ncbi:MAG: hypothetical protein CUN55_04955 [Phototrophicales bacterium]|nr:MAG: hypothetical protein CUN55_04955 [Phototrophicales bacterium]
MNSFQRWALATTIATFFLILVGGLVRAADAGLGCPDWPKCFDRWYPPLTVDQVPDHIDPNLFDVRLAWIEYINRIVGVTVGFLILGTVYHALRSYRQKPRVLYPSLLSLVLVLIQGWLGGEVVASELNPLHITAHLVLAWVIVNLLLYATVEAFFLNSAPFVGMSSQRRILGRLSLVLLVLVLIQAGLGADLRGELEIIERDYPQLVRSEWIHEAGWVDIVHRSFSWLIIFAVAALNFYVYRRLQGNTRWLQWNARFIAALVLIQIMAGIGLAYGGLPPVLQALHLLVGSLLISSVVLMYLLAGRVPEIEPNEAQKSASLIHFLKREIA